MPNLGLDIGAVSISTVLMDDDNRVVETHYDYCHGEPFRILAKVLREIVDRHGAENLGVVATTGSGGKRAVELIGGSFVNEVVAQSLAVSALHPDVRTAIELGGESSKILFMSPDGNSGKSLLSDFAINSVCAAGTGSFLDQQATRLGVTIDDGFGELALKSEEPPRMAGRCSVFAKSDMIHLQQIATPVHDIVAGLCFAVARNVKSGLARGRTLEKPVLFAGGVAANAGMRRALGEVFGLNDGEMIIPEDFTALGAIGALMHVRSELGASAGTFAGLEALEKHQPGGEATGVKLKPLVDLGRTGSKEVVAPNLAEGQDELEVYLGLDVGSLSTNVVLIDADENVIARRYLPTASRPLEAIQRGISEIYDEVGESVVVRAAASTGSGRYLTGDFVGADVIVNEITAQATAAIAHDREVDTVFEIGGQDSKFISIQEGVVVDFEMNKVCAAGTGSFLEEQAERLDIQIEDFGDIALTSTEPVALGDRCTVFMESSLNSSQQKGTPREDLVAGLAYSIVQNYIHRVVGNKRIGDRIFFQGGVTNNKAVVSAFENHLGKPIIVPPHFDVTGAIGAAMLARDAVADGRPTRFKGFEVRRTPYKLSKFHCRSCANDCELRKVRIEGEKKPLLYGGRCDKWDVDDRKGHGKGIPNLFEERTALLLGDFEDDPDGVGKSGRPTIGIPRALTLFYQWFPYWRTLFEELGLEVVLSRPTDAQLTTRSLEAIAAETCLPVEVIHGHVLDLLDKGVDHVFLPFMINVESDVEDNLTCNCNCPWVQTHPFMVRAALHDRPDVSKILVPCVQFRYTGRVLTKEIVTFAKETFGIPARQTRKAITRAARAQKEFEAAVQRRGSEVLANLPEDRISMAVIGRQYNTSDPALNLALMEKLINLAVMPIPMDFLPLNDEHIFDTYPHMYWHNGRKILQAARCVAKDDRLQAVTLGNFRCGPDSFLSHFVRDEFGSKPLLQLEIDEHSADAGVITRCEAFLDSLGGSRTRVTDRRGPRFVSDGAAGTAEGRVLWLPYMTDHSRVVAAAIRRFGTDARVLPEIDARDIVLGQQNTSCRECFPMACTVGSMIRKSQEPGFDDTKAAFFMPTIDGPCRFGQYGNLDKLIFERLGVPDIQIVAPNTRTSYAELGADYGVAFRKLVWKGWVTADLMRQMQQERKPYEANPGEIDEVYEDYLQKIERSIEAGGKDIYDLIHEAANALAKVPVIPGPRKPVILIVGEFFMRDCHFCNGMVAPRLEEMGAEPFTSPYRSWLLYTSYRYMRDSLWKRDLKGLLRSRIQQFFQYWIAHKLENAVGHVAEVHRHVPIREILEASGPYVHKHYDGDPVIAIGESVSMVKRGISGVANILPFTCMPGTLIESVAPMLRRNHDNIPWVDVAYDGTQDQSIETRLQAFMHQAREYARRHGLDAPRKW